MVAGRADKPVMVSRRAKRATVRDAGGGIARSGPWNFAVSMREFTGMRQPDKVRLQGVRARGPVVPDTDMHYEYLSEVIGGPDPAARAVSERTIETLTGETAGRLPVRAVTHPLGFTCLPVERAGPHGVCVHLWSPRVPRAAATTSAIHAHCWRLTSIALFGQLENRLLTLADADAKWLGPEVR